MKWVKRLLGFTFGLVLVLGLAALAMYHFGVRGTPDWWQRPQVSAAEQAEAANRADRKIMQTLSVVREMDAASRAQAAGADPSDRRPAATQAAAPLEVTFTEAELNGFFNKWDRLYGWTERYKDRITNPGVVIHDGRIVIAGDSPELGTVVSIHLDPKLDDDGRLDLEVSRVLAGRLPIPQGFLDTYRTAGRERLKASLPAWQSKAQLRPDGSANGEAMTAAMGKLFLSVLANRPGEPVLFLPLAERDRSLPVKLTGVTVKDKSLTLTVKPLDRAGRADLIERIREPFEDAADAKAVSVKSTPGPSSDRGS
jgi:hypothetical protein